MEYESYTKSRLWDKRQPRCSKAGNAIFDPRTKPSFMTKKNQTNHCVKTWEEKPSV